MSLDPKTVLQEIATQDALVIVGNDEPVRSAWRLMNEKRIRHLPVTENGEIVGLLTPRDLGRAVQPWARFKDWGALREEDFDPKLRVGEIVSWGLATMPADTSLVEAAERMIKDKLTSLLLVDKDGRLVGIVTTEDLLRALCRALRDDEAKPSVKARAESLIYDPGFGNLLGQVATTGV